MSVHPDRVRAAFGLSLSDSTIERLLACSRLRDRLDRCLGLVGGIAPAAPAWLVSDPAEAVRRAGAVLHARAVRAVLTGPEVSALRAVIGGEAHGLALRLGGEAPPREHGGDLAAAILRDGEACLAAWVRQCPGDLRAAILLALPPGAGLETAQEAFAAEAAAVVTEVARSYGSAGVAADE